MVAGSLGSDSATKFFNTMQMTNRPQKNARLRSLLAAIFLALVSPAFSLNNESFDAIPFSTGWTLTGTPASLSREDIHAAYFGAHAR